MAVKTGLLNKTIVIERKSTALDSTGDTTGARTSIEASLSARIVENRLFGSGVGADAGPISTSTHKAFTDGDHGGEVGDMVLDGSDEYILQYIDKNPGGTKTGETGYHWEVYLLRASLERA